MWVSVTDRKMPYGRHVWAIYKEQVVIAIVAPADELTSSDWCSVTRLGGRDAAITVSQEDIQFWMPISLPDTPSSSSEDAKIQCQAEAVVSSQFLPEDCNIVHYQDGQISGVRIVRYPQSQPAHLHFQQPSEPAQQALTTILEDCILFSYSHAQITEGAAMNLLHMNDRVKFRELWIAYLQSHKNVAVATGNEGYLEGLDEQ